MFFVSVLQTFQPHIIMRFYYVCSVVRRFNRVFFVWGGGSSFVVLNCLLFFTFLLFGVVL